METINGNNNVWQPLQSELELAKHEELKYLETLRWAREISQSEKPGIFAEGYSHLIRFRENENGYWIPCGNQANLENQIDIMEFEGGYLYYIKEHSWEHLIFSRDLFYDFNKPTTKYGDICRLSDAACRLKNNLNGYFWEINNMDGNNICKCEYFQNFYGNRYTGVVREITNMAIRIINFKNKKIILPKSFAPRELDGVKSITLELSEFAEPNSLDEKDLVMFFSDVEKTNPKDLEDVKQIFKR